MGGGIEFLEKSEDALKREFKEELNIDIKVGKFLGISENIFNYWKTRFLVKDMPLNLNDIIKLYSFKLDHNNIIEGDQE